MLEDLELLGRTGREVLSDVPPRSGDCAMLSALWASGLNEYYSMPAMVVAGDLKINGRKAFNCKKNIPTSNDSMRTIKEKWDGHCWIEVGGYIGDLSIFRTAYSLGENSNLKNFILSEFGEGRGILVSNKEGLPNGMEYVPKYVLNDQRIAGLLRGLELQMENRV